MKKLLHSTLCWALSASMAMPAWAGPAYWVYIPDLRVTGSPDTGVPPTDGLPSDGNVSLDLAEVDFGTVNLSSASATRVLTVSNTSASVVALGTPSATPVVFSATNFCPAYLAPGLSCQVLLRFKPTEGRAYSGTATVPSSAGVRTVTLQGTGAEGALSITPSTTSFGSVTLGTFAEQTLVLRNTGPDYLFFEGAELENAPGITTSASSCLGALAPGQACSRTLRWTPTRSGALDGTLRVLADGMRYPVALSGQAQGPQLVAVPGALMIPEVLIDPAVPTLQRTIRFENRGNQPATGLSLTGTLPPEAQVSSNCGATLAVAAHCEASLTLPATTPGTVDGQVSLFSANAPVLDVPVSATFTTTPSNISPAAGLVLTPAQLAFGEVPVGTTSAGIRVTLTNENTTPRAVGRLSGASAEVLVSQNSCDNATLAPGASCEYTVALRPASFGLVSGRLALTVGSATLAQSATGTGMAGELSSYANNISFGELTLGGAVASQSVTLFNQGNAPLTLGSVQGSVAGASAQSNCPSSLAAGDRCTVTVLVNPATQGPFSGTYQLSAGSRTAVFPVSGEVVKRTLELSSEKLSWNPRAQDVAPDTRTVLVHNIGTSPQTGLAVSVAGDYTASTTCTSSLAAGASCAVSLTPSSNAVGPHLGTLTVRSDDVTVTAALDATVTAVRPTLSSGTVDFGLLAPGVAGTPRQVVISNTSSVPVTLGALALNASSAFTASHNCPALLAVGASCTAQFGFTPAAAGVDMGELVGSTFSISLVGEGAYGALRPSTGLVQFGLLQLNANTSAQTVTVTNDGTQTVSFTGASLDNPQAFQFTNGCGASLAPNASCSLTVRALTVETGAKSGRLTLGSSAGALVIRLASEVARLPVLSASPTSVNFGVVDAAFTSAPRTVTLTNTGLSDLVISSVSGYTGGAGMVISNGCTAPVPMGSSCTVSLTVRPPVVNARNETLVLQTNTTQGEVEIPVTFALRNNPVTLSTPSGQAVEAFSYVNQGEASAERSFTLRNDGAGFVRVTGIQSNSASFKVVGGSCSGAELGAGETCTVDVRFEPTAPGTVTGLLSVTTTSGQDAVTAGFSGIGVSVFSSSSMPLSPASLTYAPVAAGSAAVSKPVTLTNNNAFSVTLGDFETSDARLTVDAGTCTNGKVLAAGASCGYSVSFQSNDPIVLSYQTVTLRVPSHYGSVSQQVVSAETTGSAPTLTSLSATSAVTGSGTKVTLTGTNFYSGARVLVNGALPDAQWSATRTSKTSMTINVGELPAGTYALSVATSYGASNAVDFTVEPLPAPKLTVSTTSLDFGNVATGEVASLSLVLQNTGNASLTFTSPVGLTGNAAFTSTTDCGSSLAKNASCTLTVQFAPTSLGAVSAQVALATNDATFSSTVSTSGTGVTPARLLSISPAVGGRTSWDLDTNGPLVLSSAGTYTITPQYKVSTSVKLWGAGGGGGRSYAGIAYIQGGGGGAAQGTVELAKNTSYTVIVGGGGQGGSVGNPAGGSPGWGGSGRVGGTGYYAGAGGGLSGLFAGTGITDTSASNALLVAGGGGGGGAAGSTNYSCTATAGGGSTVLNVGSPYGSGTAVAAPTSSSYGWGSTSMAGANAGPVSTWDGRGGGGGGYRGGGAYQTASAAGCFGGTGGLGFAAASVTSASLYAGGQTAATYMQAGLAADSQRGGAGQGGGNQANGTAGRVVFN